MCTSRGPPCWSWTTGRVGSRGTARSVPSTPDCWSRPPGSGRSSSPKTAACPSGWVRRRNRRSPTRPRHPRSPPGARRAGPRPATRDAQPPDRRRRHPTPARPQQQPEGVPGTTGRDLPRHRLLVQRPPVRQRPRTALARRADRRVEPQQQKPPLPPRRTPRLADGPHRHRTPRRERHLDQPPRARLPKPGVWTTPDRLPHDLPLPAPRLQPLDDTHTSPWEIPLVNDPKPAPHHPDVTTIRTWNDDWNDNNHPSELSRSGLARHARAPMDRRGGCSRHPRNSVVTRDNRFLAVATQASSARVILALPSPLT
jgi:hypothetical protein